MCMNDILCYLRIELMKAASPTFRKGTDCLEFLRRDDDLIYNPKDYEGKAEAKKARALARINKRKADFEKVSAMLGKYGIDLIWYSAYRSHYFLRDPDYYVSSSDSILLTVGLPLSDPRNQAALVLLRDHLKYMGEKYSAYPIKARLMEWFTKVIKEG